MKTHTLTALAALALATTAFAKLPPPSDEAKAKAAEAAAKTAWTGKVDAYKLCQSQDKVAAGYRAAAKKNGKDAGTVVETPACADPGPFVYTPPAPASGAASTAVAAPAPASAPAKKG
ncbi:hypothetical protein KAK06_02540 [Ideonella sp. 4Y11]|uniref:Uncharacterized protein n=1 Tax=Ideonella aquatica TaxID=2824119 RepID=A0A940YKA5_9BURK|nr:hypothetical protein [Ideonella aquatica]MBQ0957826.1 hypothetical protein [Ideonella aquatica]